MAGMEQLEIHSKSYLVRWVDVKAGHTISWSVKPEKKSINFGIFKHPKSENKHATQFPSCDTYEPPPTPGLRHEGSSNETQPTRNAQSTAAEKLKSFGLYPVSWYGACEANRVATGKYDVPQYQGGMYALVFDNTFSKQLSKKATFVLLTYPTDTAPQTTHHAHHIQGALRETSKGPKEASGQRVGPASQSSAEGLKTSVPDRSGGGKQSGGMNGYGQGEEHDKGDHRPEFHTGVLQKRRRKKHQGWALRFFSLDLASATMSYYHDRNSLALRGAVPLSVAAIGANAKTRQISIDSGAEIWHLKAPTQQDFEAWKQALEQAARQMSGSEATALPSDIEEQQRLRLPVQSLEEHKWAKVNSLIDALERTRDAARTIARDTDPKYLPQGATKPTSLEKTDSKPLSGASSKSGSPVEANAVGYFGNDIATEKPRPFWKRKQSGDRPMPGMFARSVSATSSTIPQRLELPSPTAQSSPLTPECLSDDGIHNRCMALLNDLESIVSDFISLTSDNKPRQATIPSSAMSRHSIDSVENEEYFDAEGLDSSQLLALQHESDDDGDVGPVAINGESASDSEIEEPAGNLDMQGSAKPALGFPVKQKSLVPLPANSVVRRSTLPPATVQPPSLIGFLRKNVGKDLSTIAMPVSANEPISLLQRSSEVLEYCQLLDQAADAAHSSSQRLVFIAAFAISGLSSSRMKERSIRKPFNPMLGETFELVREDYGFRFIAEKVSHRPVRISCQADADKWSYSHSSVPIQKFWGKSAEIITEGKVRVALHTTGDHFTWISPTTFLRNIIAGEKYIEPVGDMTILNHRTGEKAIITFKSGGMFSGRSEDVAVRLYSSTGEEQSLGVSGKWTTSLHITENSSAHPNPSHLWSAGELVADATKRYGFTSFAASLNEITEMEEGRLPPTDSRMRPDQRASEDGDLDAAEQLKAKLEEAQRQRRKHLEDLGCEYQPKWFHKVGIDEDGEEIWVARTRDESYWSKRQSGNWDGIGDIF